MLKVQRILLVSGPNKWQVGTDDGKDGSTIIKIETPEAENKKETIKKTFGEEHDEKSMKESTYFKH